MKIQVRPAGAAKDRDAIRDVYTDAFPPEELTQVVELALALLDERISPAPLPLVALAGDRIIGHVAFSPVHVSGGHELQAWILAPLAVTTAHHKRGVGSMLVRVGLERLRDSGVELVFVYGDPAYYGRFGFTAEAAKPFAAPYPLSQPHGWLAAWLDEADPTVSGRLSCVPPLGKPELW